MNVVLIGMPGSGKTTIGEMLSNKLKFEFYDSDAEIEKHSGKKITQIFSEDGEKTFREIESRIIKNLSEKEHSIISLGGGAILRKENIENVKRNGKIIFINRPLEEIVNDIEVAERPLLKNGKEAIYKLYAERIDLYKKYADIEIANDISMEEVVEKMMECVKWRF